MALRSSRFEPYTGIPSSLPPGAWRIARYGALAATLAMAWLVIADPPRGLMLFWQLLMPSLPLLFAAAPGLWRQLCPMALANQLPVEQGWSKQRILPAAVLDYAYIAGVVLFLGAILLRRPFLVDSATATATLILAALGLAFAGGLVFQGRSGWCGTFCPLGPIQKLYGHAPPVVVPNGYCPTCIGCQRNCYDFNPNAALLADLNELPPRLADHRTVFAGLLPGLVVAPWLADPYGVQGTSIYLAQFAGCLLVSLGAFYAAKSLLPLSTFRVTAVFGMAALVLFYVYEAAPMVGAISALTGVLLPFPLATRAIQLTAVAVAARVLLEGWRNEKAYAAQREAQAGGRVGVEAVALAEGRRLASQAGIRDRSTGKSFGIDPDRTLLEVLEAGGVAMPFGCRSGTCGADPIAIVGGHENLSPPDAVEAATLRRLGLTGRARMACTCRANGPVEIDLATNQMAASPTLSAPGADAAADLAREAGIGRIVIIGNGVAGTTAAELIRKSSPSCRIDLVSRESQHFYNRMALGRVMSSRSGLDGLQLMPASWFEQRQITVWLSTIAQTIDPVRREVSLGTGETLGYDRLILATGAAAVVPDVPGNKLAGTFVVREAEDAVHLRAWVQTSDCREALVVGGGALGVEAASALVALGLRPTIVHAGPRLLDRHLDEKGAAILERFLTGKGMQIHCGAAIERLTGADCVTGARLADGTQIDAQVCVFCAGIAPNVALARTAGLKVDGGIVVDADMRSSQPDILAIGDVARPPVQPGAPRGLWTLGTQHAERAIAAMLDLPPVQPQAAPVLHLKIPGIDVRAFGVPHALGPGQTEELQHDDSEMSHRKIVRENGRLIGAVFVGPPGTARAFSEALATASRP